jgi:hypothetical protein
VESHVFAEVGGIPCFRKGRERWATLFLEAGR